jgi:hypothetical protein
MRRAVVWRSPASSELPQTNSGYAAAPYQTVTWPSLASFFTFHADVPKRPWKPAF